MPRDTVRNVTAAFPCGWSAQEVAQDRIV